MKLWFVFVLGELLIDGYGDGGRLIDGGCWLGDDGDGGLKDWVVGVVLFFLFFGSG